MAAARVVQANLACSRRGNAWHCANNQSDDDGKQAEDVFKSVQILKGISVNEFTDTMGSWPRR
jgi:hypothetical protein